jgi:hypothetical protein
MTHLSTYLSNDSSIYISIYVWCCNDSSIYISSLMCACVCLSLSLLLVLQWLIYLHIYLIYLHIYLRRLVIWRSFFCSNPAAKGVWVCAWVCLSCVGVRVGVSLCVGVTWRLVYIPHVDIGCVSRLVLSRDVSFAASLFLFLLSLQYSSKRTCTCLLCMSHVSYVWVMSPMCESCLLLTVQQQKNIYMSLAIDTRILHIFIRNNNTHLYTQ